jgi:hypothetical protein
MGKILFWLILAGVLAWLGVVYLDRGMEWLKTNWWVPFSAIVVLILSVVVYFKVTR